MYSANILFLILAGCAVKSDDASYFVVQMPEEVLSKELPSPKSLQVYWNVPSVQCKSKRIPFVKLHDRYGIIQNSLDRFRGDRVAIMYDPGYFPAIFKNATTGKLVLRNGGVPQEGDLELHIERFRKDVEHEIEDPNFDGVGIIDFESWRPIFRQNFGTLEPYQKLSSDIERERHWWWPSEWTKAEAARRFEAAARRFMQNTIAIAKELRPKARWGFYGFPYCFNSPPNVASCAKLMPEENDRLYWLWSESTALFPSIYSSVSLTTPKLSAFIKARVGEAVRLARPDTPVLPYWWFRYRDADYFTQTDLSMALQTLHRSNASGFVIWGSSADVNTPDKCHNLLNYTENVLGPGTARYTRSDSKVEELNDTDIYNDNENVTPVVTSKPLGDEIVTEGLSTVKNESNVDWDKNDVKTTTRSDSSSSSFGEISVAPSTTEMENKDYSKITTEDVITISPLIRILSTIYDKDINTSLPTKKTVLAKDITEKNDLSTTVNIDYTTQSTTFTTEDYVEINITNVENDEIFFDEEDFFENLDMFSSDDDIATSTVQSTTDNNKITTDAKVQGTTYTENTANSFISDEENNTTSVENDENFFNGEDFFDNPELFSSNVAKATTTVQSKSDDNKISTDTKVESTQHIESTANTFISTTTEPCFSDEESTVESLENNSANMEKITIKVITNDFNITEGTVETKTESFDTRQESTTESLFDNIKQKQGVKILNKSTESTPSKIIQTVQAISDEVTQSTEVRDETKTIQNWRKTLFNTDEETNETFEGNETMLKEGGPKSMGLTAGVEKVSI